MKPPPSAAGRFGTLARVLRRVRNAQSPLTVREATVACLVVVLVVVGGAAIRLVSGADAETMPTWTIGGDFAQFYIAGRILNEHQGGRLYDPSLREDLYPELVPKDSSLRLPFNYPPFIAALFSPLARLSLLTATLVFLGITPLIYVAGMWMLISRFGWPETGHRLFGVLSALSFAPFILYTWLGAQISVIGFCAVAFTLCEEDRGRPFLAGMALSMCLYKPTLLLLLLPMLMVTRRFRLLAGFATGGLCWRWFRSRRWAQRLWQVSWSGSRGGGGCRTWIAPRSSPCGTSISGLFSGWLRYNTLSLYRLPLLWEWSFLASCF